MLRFFYDRLLLAYPKTALLVILLAVAVLGYEARKLEIDASAETLILEDDRDLQFTRLVNTRYGSSDFLIISYLPRDDLFSAGCWPIWRTCGTNSRLSTGSHR